MKKKRTFLLYLIILLTGGFNTTVQAQNINTQLTNFSGEWKSVESISMGGNIVCSYDEGDRMLAETMKIEQNANFLTIDVTNQFTGAPLVSSQEKLTFDGQETLINQELARGKKYSVKWSADGETMTINSTIHLTMGGSKYMSIRERSFVYLTEVWKLSNDGQSITVQSKVTSTMFDEERSWRTVFYKVG